MNNESVNINEMKINPQYNIENKYQSKFKETIGNLNTHICIHKL